jgi:hypothetical protein
MKGIKTMEQEIGMLEFGKDVDEIEAPVLLPEDYYLFVVSGTPKSMKNAAMEKNPSDPKAGFNWVVPLKTLDRDNPEFNNRTFSAYLPLPKPEDEEAYDGRGQKLYDAKMERIAKFVTAFGGQVAGKTVMLAPGSKAGLQVVQQVNPRTGDLTNSLNIFGEYKTAAEMGWNELETDPEL